MSEEFRLPASSYDELTKIITAYGNAKEGSLDELSQLCGLHNSVISRNSGFLLAVGIVEGGRTKTITKRGHELARAIEHEIEHEVSRLWRDLVRDNDFLNKMFTAIKIRRGMDVQSFQSHIAYSSGQKPSSYVKTGSGTVVEIFKRSGLIVEIDGKLIPSTDGMAEPEKEGTLDTPPQPRPVTVVGDVVELETPSIGINIEVRINAEMSDLDELGEKLKRLLSDIRRGKAQASIEPGDRADEL